MSHVRTQIREATAARLTGLSTTGAHVFQSRMRPQKSEGLPCLLITTNEERIDSGSVGSMLQREISVVIHGLAMAGTNLDDTLDQIAFEVETAMAADYKSALEKIEVDFEEDLEKPVGRISLTYRTTVLTNAGNPGVMI